MKTIEKAIAIVTLGAIFLVGTIPSFAQSSSYSRQNVLKVKPLSFELGYERALNDFMSVQTGIRVLPFHISFNDDEASLGYTNVRIMPEVRFYLVGKNGAPEGFFVAPYAKVGFTSVKAETESDTDLTARVNFKGNSFGTGVTAGWQWITDGGFSIDTQFGWGYNRLKFRDVEVAYEDGTTEIEESPITSFHSFLPRFSFSIGYAF